MRKTTFTSAMLCVALYAMGAAKPKNDYIERYKDIALQESATANIPASINIAQGILESNWGEGTLAQVNNHFGIKCHSEWTGATFSLRDDDYDAQGNLIESCFRAYETPEESWKDHTIFLQKPRYQSLYQYGNDYRAWATGLQSANYATDPAYATKLINIIERYELYKLDGLDAPIVAPIFLDELEATMPKAERISEKINERKVDRKIDKKVENKTITDSDELEDIVPQKEQLFDELPVKTETPKAIALPSSYKRGNGREILENLFDSFKKASSPRPTNKSKQESNELDEIIPEKATMQPKGGDKRTSGRIVLEKVVAMK